MITTPNTGGGGGSSATAIKELMFTGRSEVDQVPTGTDTPMQVSFGPAKGGVADPAQLSAAGAVTINEGGLFDFDILLAGGREGASGTSKLFARVLVNGTQVGNSIHAKLPSATNAYPFVFNESIPLPTSAVVTIEFYRDSDGSNSGSLLTASPTLGDWAIASSAILTVSRLVPVDAQTPDPTPVRSNRVLVKSKTDLPLPVAGVINLSIDTDYEINGLIDLGSDYLKLNGDNTIYGIHPALDILLTNNPTGLFYGRDSGLIAKNFTPVNTGGGIFDMECTAGNEATKSIFVSNCFLANSLSLGRVKDFLITSFEKNAFRSMSDGIVLEGTSNKGLRLTGNVFEETSQGTVVDLGTSIFEAISIDHNFIDASVGLVVLAGLPNSGNISSSGQGVIQSNTTFGGNLPNILGVSYKDSRWNWGLNNNVPDSRAIGALYMENNGQDTLFPSNGTPIKVAGNTLAGENIQRFEMTGNNTLKYTGNKFFDGVVTYTATFLRTTGFTNRLIRFTIYKNGVPLVGATQEAQAYGDPTSVTIIGNTTITPDDEFELWMINPNSTTSIRMTYLQCSIT